jgi:hypothetical protein
MTDADSTTKSTGGGGIAINEYTAEASADPTVETTVGENTYLKTDGLISISAEHNKAQEEMSDGTFNAGTGVSDSANTITFSLPHGLFTNGVVTYQDLNGTAVGGLTDGRTYTVIVPSGSDNQIQIGAAFLASSDSVDLTTDTIRFPVPHNLQTGDTVVYMAEGTGVVGIGGLTSGKTYTVYKVDDTGIKLKDPTLQATTIAHTDGSHISSTTVTAQNNFYNGAAVTYHGDGEEFSFTSRMVDVAIETVDGETLPKRDADSNVIAENNDKIYIGDAGGFSVGDRVVYTVSDPSSAIGGLVNGQTYRISAIGDNDTTVQLKSNVEVSKNVNFVRSGSGDQIVRTDGTTWSNDGFVIGQSLWVS